MTGMPETRYAKSGELHIAYQVMGAGPLDLVFVPGFVTHLELQFEDPRPVRFFERLSSFSRLIRFDKRGTGLSDRMAAIPTLEERMDDVRAVMDAVGSKQAAILGTSEGGPMSILFAATYPQRTSAMILHGAMARLKWAPDNQWGRTEEEMQARLRLVEEKWGQGASVDVYAPSLASNPEYRNWTGRHERGVPVLAPQLPF
jgi:pimeloyl-ACP methyl ester carboxylesterase